MMSTHSTGGQHDQSHLLDFTSTQPSNTLDQFVRRPIPASNDEYNPALAGFSYLLPYPDAIADCCSLMVCEDNAMQIQEGFDVLFNDCHLLVILPAGTTVRV